MAEPAVELIEAHKRYGEVAALSGLSIAIPPGQVVAILGPNGAGKTTAISLMLGLRRPSAGTARLFGRDPASRRARSRCGVMLQESGLPGALRVGELVDLFRAYYPAPMPRARALALAGLGDEVGVPASRLSGGQRQRLYYALAICGDPEVIFLDEPTVGMDVGARRAFLDSIRELGAGGRTVVLTTHYLEEADQLAQRVVVIDRGRLVADAAPVEIKSRVAGRRVSFDSGRRPTELDFRSLPVSRLEIQDGRVRFYTSRAETVLAELFRRGWALNDLEVVGAGLEEAFLAITAADPHEIGAVAER